MRSAIGVALQRIVELAVGHVRQLEAERTRGVFTRISLFSSSPVSQRITPFGPTGGVWRWTRCRNDSTGAVDNLPRAVAGNLIVLAEPPRIHLRDFARDRWKPSHPNLTLARSLSAQQHADTHVGACRNADANPCRT
jgi:hypothetical protein